MSQFSYEMPPKEDPNRAKKIRADPTQPRVLTNSQLPPKDNSNKSSSRNNEVNKTAKEYVKN